MIPAIIIIVSISFCFLLIYYKYRQYQRVKNDPEALKKWQKKHEKYEAIGSVLSGIGSILEILGAIFF
ncbi:hypothetical protein QNI19_33205 [Cytophagaceae bacterium DM2B3-1]|uniref:Molybdenum ABC transporter permease n=1 Tax=Xanthocytophaga flava TaxID=3048013 RepID=A0ABT7CW08_9BACT|nr:hypothetical protein [Xanthocytophaga flavus]MDJ1497846.1 hypothetical protein [Xanthocytophaga flavus]